MTTIELKQSAFFSSNWWLRLRILLILYIDCKMIMYIILQSQNELLQSRLDRIKPFMRDEIIVNQREQLRVQLQDHRRLMREYGVIFRDLGPATILGLALHLLVHLIYFAYLFSQGKLSEDPRLENSVLSYKNPKLADKRLSEVFNLHLRKMIMLNTKKAQSILKLSISKSMGCLLIDQEDFNRSISDLSDQHRQLENLLHDKTTIWPPTNDANWKEQQTRFVSRAFGVGGLALLPSSLLIVVVALHFQHQILIERGEIPLNFSEKLCPLEQMFSVYFGLDIVVDVLVLLIVNMRDEHMLLRVINERFDRLNFMLAKLGQGTRCRALECGGSSSCTTSAISSRPITDRRLAELKSKCNQEALELYLSLRVFIDELQPTIALSSRFISCVTLQSGSLLLITLLFFNAANTNQLAIMAAITFLASSTIDLVLVVCANFEASCTKTLQRSWSLVANLTRDETGSMEQWKSDVRIRAAAFFWPVVTSIRADSFMFSQTKGCLINMETASLWHRFVEDLSGMHRHYNCSAFGLFLINYRHLLSLNFWIISVVLIFLTQRWQ